MYDQSIILFQIMHVSWCKDTRGVVPQRALFAYQIERFRHSGGIAKEGQAYLMTLVTIVLQVQPTDTNCNTHTHAEHPKYNMA